MINKISAVDCSNLSWISLEIYVIKHQCLIMQVYINSYNGFVIMKMLSYWRKLLKQYNDISNKTFECKMMQLLNTCTLKKKWNAHAYKQLIHLDIIHACNSARIHLVQKPRKHSFNYLTCKFRLVAQLLNYFGYIHS